MKNKVERERPHLTVTVSKEAMEYIREVAKAFPLKYRSLSAVVNACILACRDAGKKSE